MKPSTQPQSVVESANEMPVTGSVEATPTDKSILDAMPDEVREAMESMGRVRLFRTNLTPFTVPNFGYLEVR